MKILNADPDQPALPRVEMQLDRNRAAPIVIDPQIDFLSPKGVAWGAFGASLTEPHTVEHIGRLFKAVKHVNIPVALSPHYSDPPDHTWRVGGPGETLMHTLGMFDRTSPLALDGFEHSGADWMPEYRASIEDGEPIVCSPPKVFGP